MCTSESFITFIHAYNIKYFPVTHEPTTESTEKSHSETETKTKKSMLRQAERIVWLAVNLHEGERGLRK